MPSSSRTPTRASGSQGKAISSARRTFEMATARTAAASGATPRPSRPGPRPATDATTEPPLEQVQTVGARLDGVVPKAEFNDGSVLAPLPEGVVARVLDWCSAYRAGAAAATCKALRRAAALSAGVRAQKDAARPRLPRRGGGASYEWREACASPARPSTAAARSPTMRSGRTSSARSPGRLGAYRGPRARRRRRRGRSTLY